MAFLAIILSLIAIAMAYAALQRTGGLTGGLKDLKQQMDHLASKTEEVAKGARETTADILHRLEHRVRGSEAQSSEPYKNVSRPQGPGSDK
jgi:hypothetical protein